MLIRLAEEGDAPQIAAIYAPVVRDTIISFETEPPSAEEITRHVREDARQKGVGRALQTSLIAALNLQGFYKAYGGIALPNNTSVGLHEAWGSGW